MAGDLSIDILCGFQSAAVKSCYHSIPYNSQSEKNGDKNEEKIHQTCSDSAQRENERYGGSIGVTTKFRHNYTEQPDQFDHHANEPINNNDGHHNNEWRNRHHHRCQSDLNIRNKHCTHPYHANSYAGKSMPIDTIFMSESKSLFLSIIDSRVYPLVKCHY